LLAFRLTPLFLPLEKDAAEAAINKLIFLRLEPQINTRQKQWSDIYNPYQQMERRAYAC
jgi:hypothetical protein